MPNNSAAPLRSAAARAAPRGSSSRSSGSARARNRYGHGEALPRDPALAVPRGREFGISSGTAFTGEAAMPKYADFGFTKLVVSDLERSAAFYKAVCGLEESGRVDADIAGRKISEIMLQPTTPGGATLVLLRFHDLPRPASDEVILGFMTPDLEAFLTRTRGAGGRVYEDTKSMPEHGVRVAFVKDVEGHLIEVVQLL
jgi:lactoylglutathione lyase